MEHRKGYISTNGLETKSHDMISIVIDGMYMVVSHRYEVGREAIECEEITFAGKCTEKNVKEKYLDLIDQHAYGFSKKTFDEFVGVLINKVHEAKKIRNAKFDKVILECIGEIE